MDHTTLDLIRAVEFLLNAGHIPGKPGKPGQPDSWTFQKDSEIHAYLTEAVTSARIALGMDRPKRKSTQEAASV